MQFLVALVSVCLLAFVAADEFGDKRKAIIAQCKQKLSASDDVVNAFNSKKEPENTEQSCFLECFYETLGLIKDGKLNEEGATALGKQKFGNDSEKIQKADAVFKKCKSEYVATNEKCGLGKYVRKCLIENDNKDINFFKSN